MSGALWTDVDAEAATGGRSNRPWSARGVAIDSRTLAAGDLFVAIKGETHDGHDHVAAALAAGAAAALVNRPPAGLPRDCALIVVPDTLEALARLGIAARARIVGTRIAAVTGSVGKTSTKDALRLVLAAQAATHAAAASFNNHIGVPLTLARLPRDAAYAVFEVGMNHAGEIAPLARMIRPELALVTTVEAVHTEFFADGIDGVAAAKAEIFAAGGRVAVLNRDNRFFERLAAEARRRGFERIVGFGGDAAAEARLVDMRLDAGSTTVAAMIDGRAISYRVGAPGRHWAMNSLAVLAAADALGADIGTAAATLAEMSPPKGRGRRHVVERDGESFVVIDDSYNASPVSMRAAFEVLANSELATGGRRIAVLGDMRELGAEAPSRHAELAEALVERRIDLVFACGPHMASLFAALPARMRGAYSANSTALLPLVRAAIRRGDVVVVKGSLGSRMGPIVEALLGGHANGNGAPNRAAG
ncbi:MAG: UDP-N-acetylmuramoylalanyl-D-glutamyl-2,6-diaminopimelate--D-alanyl-D-alanine ligase [Aestuariivirga sp.]